MRRHAAPCPVIDGGAAPFGGTWIVASSMLARLGGLARRAPDHTVMVFPRCNDVHTFTMKHALDIAFADKDGRIIAVHRAVPPRTRLRYGRAATVVERFSREGPWFERGDVLALACCEKRGGGGRCGGLPCPAPRGRRKGEGTRGHPPAAVLKKSAIRREPGRIAARPIREKGMGHGAQTLSDLQDVRVR